MTWIIFIDIALGEDKGDAPIFPNGVLNGLIGV